MDYYWLPELIELAERSDAKGPKISKAHESIDFINQNAQDKILRNILIVGGGSCEREVQLLFNSPLSVDEFATFTCIDKFEPCYFNCFANSCIIEWIQTPLCSSNIPQFKYDFDAIICLGAGRYMKNCSQIYHDLIRCGSSGSLLILDFMIQSPLLKSAVSHWHKYFSDHWIENKQDVLCSLDDLTNLSMGLGKSLASSDASVSSKFSPFSSTFKINNLQSFVFDYIFPFWFQSGEDYSQTRSMILWYLCVICSYPSFEELERVVAEYPLKKVLPF